MGWRKDGFLVSKLGSNWKKEWVIISGLLVYRKLYRSIRVDKGYGDWDEVRVYARMGSNMSDWMVIKYWCNGEISKKTQKYKSRRANMKELWEI